MPTALEAFNLAFGMNLAGVFFEGAWMLTEISEGAPEALAQACSEKQEALAAQAPMTRRHIRSVNKSLEAAGLDVPEMPAHTEAYSEWTEQISEAYWAALGDDELAMAAYTLGWHLGSWIQSANLAAIALVLKDIEGGHPPLAEQLSSLKDTLDAAAEGLEASAGEGLDAVNKAVEHAKKAPPPNDDSQEPLDVADDFQEALHELGELVEEIQAAFGE